MRRYALTILLSLPAGGAAADGGGYWTLLIENDIFAGEDRKYTNGTYLRYTTPANDLPAAGRWARDGLAGVIDAPDWYATWGLGQSMFTASDITDPDPPLDDRPYAGFLFGTFALSADTGRRLDTFALDLGVTGPLSLAEQSQKLVHQVIGDDPKGWDTQLETELAFRLVYEQARKLGGAFAGFEVDAIPQVSLALGTVETAAAGALTLRLGEGLDVDYGPQRVRRNVAGPSHPREAFGWYLFAGAEGRLVERNLFLDGNTFRDSRSVDSEPVLGEFILGASLNFGSTTFTYSHVFRTHEFKSQSEDVQFGALSLRVRF